MKKLTLLIFAFLLISCDKDSADDFENNSSNSDSGYTVIGNYYDLSINGGTQSRELYEHVNNGAEYDSRNYVNLFTEASVVLPNYEDYYADEYGITIMENAIGRNYYTFYYKSFITNEILKYDVPYFNPHDWSYWHYREKIYFQYSDFDSFNSNDGTTDFKIKIFDVNTNNETELNIGKFKWSANSKFETLYNGRYTYFLWYEDWSNPLAEKLLTVIDLDNVEVVDIKTVLKDDSYNLVGERNGNCYLLGRYGGNYQYDVESTNLLEINIPGEAGQFQASFKSKRNPQIVIDDVFFGSRTGAFPGTGALYPVIFNLKTGESIFIDVSEDITKFESDEVEWQPLVECFTIDYENKVVLLGVSSYSLGGQFKSQGVFTVDFEGNVLNKQKIPILPIQIIN